MNNRLIIKTNRNTYKYDVECLGCGKVFEARQPNTLYCSPVCRTNYKKEMGYINKLKTNTQSLQVIEQREVLGTDFRIYGTVDEPLFLAKDVANWIEHNKPSEMIANVDEDEKLKIKINHGDNIARVLQANTEYWFLTEDGLYEVLMQSRKPIAKQFKKQVKKILKEIRKNGLNNISEKEIKTDKLLLAIYRGGTDAIIKTRELVELETKELKIGENQQIKMKDLCNALGVTLQMLNDYLVYGNYGLYKKVNERKIFVPNEKFLKEIANEGHAITRDVNGNQRVTYKKSSIEYFTNNHLEDINKFYNKKEVSKKQKSTLPIEPEVRITTRKYIDNDKQEFLKERIKSVIANCYNRDYKRGYIAFYNGLSNDCRINLYERRKNSKTPKARMLSFIYEDEFDKVFEYIFFANRSVYPFFKHELCKYGLDTNKYDSLYNECKFF